MNAMKFHEDIARRKLTAPPEWQACVYERIGPDALRLDGAIPRPLTRGPRKGQLTWRGLRLESCVVTNAEVATECSKYERDTGNCSECQGEGQVPWSWSVAEGAKHRTCAKCNGTGKAAS